MFFRTISFEKEVRRSKESKDPCPSGFAGSIPASGVPMKSNKKTIFITAIIFLIVIAGIISINMAQSKETKVKLETNYGEIVIQLYDKEMPTTAGNFKTLVSKGFYDGVIFHRVIEGFMIQGGDPTGTGTGGPGYTIKDEFTKSVLDKNNRGTVSMANAGPNTGGSQFFINLVDNNFLDGRHPVFGRVVSGMDVVDKIAKVEADSQDRPLTPVVIEKASVM